MKGQASSSSPALVSRSISSSSQPPPLDTAKVWEWEVLFFGGEKKL